MSDKTWKVETYERWGSTIITISHGPRTVGSLQIESELFDSTKWQQVENILNEKPIEHIVRAN